MKVESAVFFPPFVSFQQLLPNHINSTKIPPLILSGVLFSVYYFTTFLKSLASKFFFFFDILPSPFSLKSKPTCNPYSF